MHAQKIAGVRFQLTSTVPYGTPPAMNQSAQLKQDPDPTQHLPSKRQQEVLAAVLDLMVEEGDGFSMASVAKRASCSKETLYRWYGDRDGLLTATVRWQASKVIMPRLDGGELSREIFCKTLQEFAESWLAVLTSDVSIALNRLAVSHAGNARTNLGRIVLENGPLAMRQRLSPIFRIGNELGFIVVDEDEAFRMFFGLVVADVQIRVLLGDFARPDVSEMRRVSDDAVKRMMKLYGNEN